MLNDRVLPYYKKQGVQLLRILTDRGTEFCGKVEHHAFEFSLSIEDIDHSKTKAYSPQTNGICERFHKTIDERNFMILLLEKRSTPHWKNCRQT
jgi:transposase InsO family protein